ncbi:hypothetical protein [Flavobacterium pedocola]
MKTKLTYLLILISTTVYSQTVKINCPSEITLKKDISLGYLNYRSAQIGEIYATKLNGTKIKRISPLGKKNVETSNVDESTVTGLKEYKTKIGFTLDASADISPTLLADLKSELKKEVKFELVNSRIKMIKDPLKQIEYYDPNIFPIKSGEVYVLINRIIVADSLKITTNTGLDIDTNSKVKLGEYEISIVNNCNFLLQIKGNMTPVFFEFLIFKANVVTTKKQVVGNLKSGEPKTVEVKRVIWQQLTGIELE